MPTPFDLEVTKRNAKGQVVSESPYRCTIEGGTKLFERPIGSGFWYTEGDGENPVRQPAKPVIEVTKAESRPLKKD